MDFVQAVKTIKAELKGKREQEENALSELLKGKDISEVVQIMMCAGNSYNRRTLRFFRWFCKWMPVTIMLFHWLCLYDYASSERDTFVMERNAPLCDGWTYFMIYILPMVIILASRFFFLCWKYRIPFFYFFGVNAIHLCYMSPFTTKEMLMAHMVVVVSILIFYFYAFAEWFLKTDVGRKLF